MREKKTMRRSHKGSAALCAILIMIMLLAIGTAVLVVTGRTGIKENDHMPANAALESFEMSQPDEDTSSLELPMTTLMQYPEKGYEFQTMNIDGLTAKYAVLLDIENNDLYTAKNYTKKAYPASLTKIMTVVVALENCTDLNDTYTFTKEDIKSLQDENASVAGFKAGEKVTVEDLLYGAMLPSGADATLGIANYIAGSEENFVKLMNEKVEQLGLTGTHFTNASGLHNPDHYSTAMDIALIVKYAVEDPKISADFLKIASAKSYVTSETKKHPDGITLESIYHKRFEGFFIDRDYDGKPDAEIYGGKTGFTDQSGYSLASIYRIDGAYYVCVTIHSSSTNDATTDNVNIAERYLPTYDLLEPENASDSSSSSSETTDENSSAVDTTPKPIDQTESDAQYLLSSSEDDTEQTDGEE